VEIHHFEYGFITPALSYALSVLGSLLGLTCATRVREAKSAAQRGWWLMLAAWAIGGTAIWSMHFMAMLGFSVVGQQIRFDVALTAASALLAVVVVGIGLFIAALGRPSILKIVAGGVFAGIGVAGMHYTGMAAMRVDAEIHYEAVRVGLSVAIAVVAATVAFWLVVNVRGALATVASALVMGIAVNGMHFTGMSAMSAHEHPTPGDPSGATASNLLVPIILAVILVAIALIYAVLAAPNEEDRAGLAYMDSRLADRANAPAPEPPPAPHGLAARRTNFPSSSRRR
jgi:NO-binding membrane sensor protein with MHYT domain